MPFSMTLNNLNITCRIAVREGESYGQRQHVQKISLYLDICFWDTRAVRQTDGQTDRHADAL